MYNDKLIKQSRTLDSLFVGDLTILYLYLTKYLHLSLDIYNEDTKRAGFDFMGEHFMPKLRDIRTFVKGSIKCMYDGKKWILNVLLILVLKKKIMKNI